jgi:hypothetical protein
LSGSYGARPQARNPVESYQDPLDPTAALQPPEFVPLTVQARETPPPFSEIEKLFPLREVAETQKLEATVGELPSHVPVVDGTLPIALLPLGAQLPVEVDPVIVCSIALSDTNVIPITVLLSV